MELKKILKPVLIIALVLLVLIQFFQIDKTNPPVTIGQDFLEATNPPPAINSLIKKACYDCHSNTSKYPWYTNIQPVAWWVEGHIRNGRKELNFSTWTTYERKRQAHKLDECVEVLEEKEMPMLSYMVAHPEAWINAEQREQLANWFEEIEAKY